MSNNPYADMLREVRYNINILNNEERIFLNAIMKGKNLPKYSKEEARADLRFAMLCTPVEEFKDIYKGLIATFDTWSDEVWYQIKMVSPLPCDDYSDEDGEDIV